MFRKLITLMMVVTLFTVQAQAATQNGLKAAFDEMNYTLTVEWDQKDQSFYEAQMKKFNTTVRDLKKNGLTNAEMVEFAKSQIKDAKVAKDLETAFSMITINKMSTEEASKYISESMKRAYSNGASWNGDGGVLYLVAGILLIALVIGAASGGVVITDNGYSCFDDCYYYDYSCGYDFWGPIYCESYTCDTVCY